MSTTINLDAEKMREVLFIKQDFISINKQQKKDVINILSQKHRKIILDIFESNSTIAELSDLKEIKLKINNSRNFKNPISRNSYRTSVISNMKKKIMDVVGEIAYFFNFLTAEKTDMLIRKAIFSNKNDNKINEFKIKKLISDEKVNLKSNEKINLADLLSKNNFSTEIFNLTINEDLFNDVDFDSVKFCNCTFDFFNFEGKELKNIEFLGCEIKNCNITNAKLESSSFIDCKIQETIFTASELKKTVFINSNVDNSSFEDALIEDCSFVRSSLHGTHFLGASVLDSSIFESNLENTVFFKLDNQFDIDKYSRKTAKITHPLSTILVDPGTVGITTPKAFMKLDQSAHLIPLRLTMKAQKVKQDEMRKEIEVAFEKIKEGDQGRPIPQRLIEELMSKPEVYKECAIILNKAEQLASVVNSFFLPGGEDLPPALYGQEADERTHWGDDYRRSLLEMGIIHRAFTQGIPLMGVCRGFQMCNVFFGAQLSQNVEGQEGLQTFDLEKDKAKGLFDKRIHDNFRSVVFHHQGVPVNTVAKEALETRVVYDGLVKAAEMKQGSAAPMVLLQFHPEFLNAPTAPSMKRELVDAVASLWMSPNNDVFWKIFGESAQAHKNKQAVLEQVKVLNCLNSHS